MAPLVEVRGIVGVLPVPLGPTALEVIVRWARVLSRVGGVVLFLVKSRSTKVFYGPWSLVLILRSEWYLRLVGCRFSSGLSPLL